MEKTRALLGAAVVLFIGIALVIYTRSSPPPVTGKKILMDTYVTVTVYGPENKAKNAINDAFSAMFKVEKKLSRFNSESEISKINKNSGSPIKVSRFTYQTLKLAKKYNRLSNGYYDITIGNVVSLWDFNKQKIPGPKNVKKALATIKPNELLLLKGNKVKISKGMALDLGSILKGEAVDAAQKELKKHGITKALITTGSSTTLIGKKATGKKWAVGIQHPRKADEILAVISGENITISTSGDYQQYFKKKGKRYNHIINPKTGYPQNGFMSVTLISTGSAAEADIISTAMFAMGPKKGIAFAKKNNFDFIAVNNKGTVYKNTGTKRYIAGQITY